MSHAETLWMAFAFMTVILNTLNGGFIAAVWNAIIILIAFMVGASP